MAVRLPPRNVGATLTIDPGQHRVEATAPGYGSAALLVTMRERDVTFLEVALPPAPTAVVPAPGAPPRAVEDSPRSEDDAAPHPLKAPPLAPVLASVGALALAGLGVGAYVAAGRAHDAGVESCAQRFSAAADACQAEKTTVRDWDWTAAGAWAGAAVIATVAVLLWLHAPRAATSAVSAHFAPGPGTLGIGGSF